MHGFELTSTPPPYPYMAMAGVKDSFFLMPLPPRTTQNTATASYHTRSASFTTALAPTTAPVRSSVTLRRACSAHSWCDDRHYPGDVLIGAQYEGRQGDRPEISRVPGTDSEGGVG